ncbi:hypothetical protein TWF694_011655 [Orbilia ellipsospora]|uniref:Subtilisin n=1 Tax=Orbilia ellipsospora TaxID=2528407 RepID=A0AAV9X5U3_9PEZI
MLIDKMEDFLLAMTHDQDVTERLEAQEKFSPPLDVDTDDLFVPPLKSTKREDTNEPIPYISYDSLQGISGRGNSQIGENMQGNHTKRKLMEDSSAVFAPGNYARALCTPERNWGLEPSDWNEWKVDDTQGAGTIVYVIDSGWNINHKVST